MVDIWGPLQANQNSSAISVGFVDFGLHGQTTYDLKKRGGVLIAAVADEDLAIVTGKAV